MQTVKQLYVQSDKLLQWVHFYKHFYYGTVDITVLIRVCGYPINKSVSIDR